MNSATLPWVIASSVIRTAHMGESHGGLYIVDLNSGECEQVINWDTTNISFRDRGAERGLRGIEFYDGKVIVTSCDYVMIFDRDFKKLDEFGNRYLKDCHETSIDGDRLYVTSTRHDSILVFDLVKGEFVEGYCFRNNFDRILKKAAWKIAGLKLGAGIKVKPFNPNGPDGPDENDVIHVNNVRVVDGSILVSAYRSDFLYRVDGTRYQRVCRLPRETHNVQPLGDGFVACSTGGDAIVMIDANGRVVRSFPVVSYDESQLSYNHLSKDYARQAFARGLCTYGDSLIIAGSSPATVTAYDVQSGDIVRSVNLTVDVRNSIHGLEVYPWSTKSISAQEDDVSVAGR